MSKNILVISSSFRKGGNSDSLCDRFIIGAKEAGNKVERIYLNDKNINYCQGCGACYTSKICKLNDDMSKILKQMIDADVIVMATPVYFYSMNGQMKTFIDRTVAKYTEITNKDFYYIMTAAEHNRHAMDRTIEGFRGFLDCLSGAKEKGIIYGTGAWKIGDIQSTAAMKEAYEMGRKVI